MVGGVDKHGHDATNELSYLILHMVGLLKLPSPTVNFRWHSLTPRWFLNKAIETNVKTKGGIPLFQNDMHLTKCFVRDGEPLEKARNYNALGCVTPVADDKVEHQGSEGIGAINVAFVLDMTLHNGVSAVTGKKWVLRPVTRGALKRLKNYMKHLKNNLSLLPGGSCGWQLSPEK